jgi:predicted metal-dependent hydrolase
MTRHTLELPGQPPFSYRIRLSRRARYLALRITPREGVCAVCPVGTDPALVHDFVRHKADWILRHLHRFPQATSPLAGMDAALPERVPLPALGECWTLHYQHRPAAPLRLRMTDPQRLLVEGDLPSGGATETAVQGALRRWLAHRAGETLPDWLGQLAGETGMAFAGVVIKGQRSRWGSCSARGNINLNRNLLFLPPEQVRYVLIHELCHTRELNHSARFWTLVGRHEPRYAELRRALREGWRQIPGWAHPPPRE